ncbi:MAG: hypothetical protein KJ621_09430, partial [Proteobacteria bacterium]|nr:hypothetical protein [Pseudomonadota bacterium]MBU1743072.1 hypothetical protein [Pseudomonadota bacterium]
MNAPPDHPTKDMLIPVVCRPWCDYFKPDQVDPDEECGGLMAVRELLRLKPDLIEPGPSEVPVKGDAPDARSAAARALCPACPYQTRDCDFVDPEGPADAPPCGGVRLLADFLDQGHIDRNLLARAGR